MLQTNCLAEALRCRFVMIEPPKGIDHFPMAICSMLTQPVHFTSPLGCRAISHIFENSPLRAILFIILRKLLPLLALSC